MNVAIAACVNFLSLGKILTLNICCFVENELYVTILRISNIVLVKGEFIVKNKVKRIKKGLEGNLVKAMNQCKLDIMKKLIEP